MTEAQTQRLLQTTRTSECHPPILEKSPSKQYPDRAPTFGAPPPPGQCHTTPRLAPVCSDRRSETPAGARTLLFHAQAAQGTEPMVCRFAAEARHESRWDLGTRQPGPQHRESTPTNASFHCSNKTRIGTSSACAVPFHVPCHPVHRRRSAETAHYASDRSQGPKIGWQFRQTGASARSYQMTRRAHAAGPLDQRSPATRIETARSMQLAAFATCCHQQSSRGNGTPPRETVLAHDTHVTQRQSPLACRGAVR